MLLLAAPPPRTMLLLALFSIAAAASPADDPVHGGSRYVTSHAAQQPIDRASTGFDDEPVLKEFHFHVYFHVADAGDCPHCNDSYVAALRVRDALVEGVAARRYVAVLAGVTPAMLPGLNASSTYPINTRPQGPHPCGSYEVWVPREYLAAVLDVVLRERGELSVFFHPLSAHAVEDHVGRSMWLGPPFRLNLNALDDDGDPPQYPELGLGYHAGADVRPCEGARGQWWRSTPCLPHV